jgi:hypothetical protein
MANFFLTVYYLFVFVDDEAMNLLTFLGYRVFLLFSFVLHSFIGKVQNTAIIIIIIHRHLLEICVRQKKIINELRNSCRNFSFFYYIDFSSDSYSIQGE